MTRIVGTTTRILLASLFLLSIVAVPAAAQIANGGFEAGATGWTAGGVGAVEVIDASGLTPAIAPPEGGFMALLSTGPGDRGGATGDWDANGTDDDDSTTFSVTFDIVAAPTGLSFDWAFITAEENEDLGFDDFFEVRLNGALILARSVLKPGGVSPYQDTPAYDGTAYTAATGGGPVDGSSFPNGTTGFQSFCLAISTPGTYTLEFRIADQQDALFDSGLLIDDVVAPSPCAGSGLTQITQTSGSNLEAKGGGFVFTAQSNREVELARDGAVIAFTSDGNHDFSNPNLRTQIWTVEGSTIARASNLASGSAKHPALTSNGRWLVYAASGDPTGGNTDGNFEIFRYDRLLDQTLQITDTTNCENRQPTVSNDNQGRRIAFLTDCTDLDAGFNADGSDEFVHWTNDGTFRFEEGVGCNDSVPRLSRHNAGRYVSFISDCDYEGTNADGNREVFQYNRNGNMNQVTNTAAPANHDAISSNWNGRFVSFLSSADLTGSNADGSLEVFLWDRNASVTQLTDAPATTVYLSTSIDDDGDYVAFERFDLLLGVFEVGWIDTGTSAETVVQDGPDVSLPKLGVESGNPVIAFQASSDWNATNNDGNLEIWTDAAGFGSENPNEACSRPALAIPDDGSVVAELSVTSLLQIADLNLYLDITHGHVGDLTATLEHVDSGTSVLLVDRPGDGGGGLGCAGDDVLAVLDDGAASAVEDACDPGVPTISGTLTPNNPLAAFANENYDGTWRLTLTDEAPGDTGTLVEWCLFFEPVP